VGRRWFQVTAAAAGVVLVSAGSVGTAIALTGHQAVASRPAATAPAYRAPTPAKTIYVTPQQPKSFSRTRRPRAPAPQAPAPQAPSSGAHVDYLAALRNAGIVAPDNWAVQAASNLEAGWHAGQNRGPDQR
jgi:hypothetical protein